MEVISREFLGIPSVAELFLSRLRVPLPHNLVRLMLRRSQPPAVAAFVSDSNLFAKTSVET